MTHRYTPPWEARHRTIRVVCANCIKTSHITLYGLPSEYRGMVGLEKCGHCGTIGKLTTSDLAKTRPKKDSAQQLTLCWEKKR